MYQNYYMHYSYFLIQMENISFKKKLENKQYQFKL